MSMLGNVSRLLCVVKNAPGLLSAINEAQEDKVFTPAEVVKILVKGLSGFGECFLEDGIQIKLDDGSQKVVTDVVELSEVLGEQVQAAAKDGVITIEELGGILGTVLAACLPKSAVIKV